MYSHFETRVPGKWVLAGEHAVLKGETAVALPHPEMGLALEFEPGSGTLEVEPSGATEVIQGILDGVGLAEPIRGRLKILSSIPIGAGLGSSAALCVALTKWLAPTLRLLPEQWPDFATQLEHRFHGQSSGMDVAVICAGEAVSFVRGQGAQALGVARLPKFTFHDTGLRARTNECVARVEKLRQERPEHAAVIDARMGQASHEAIAGLRSGDVMQVGRAMEFAHECFLAWDLVPESALRLRQSLLDQGALGAKLTGAGGGGFVVAVWGG
jgi:mevalonate kinase